MAVNPSPFGPKPQFELASGVPAAGYKLFFYVAGSTSTKQNTYTDSTGASTNTNPVVLNSLGSPTNQIWFTQGQSYKVVLAPSTDTDPPTSPIWTIDNLYGINDPINAPATSQWIASGLTPTYVSATSFTLTGNQTSIFAVGRRLQTTNTAGTTYSTITASAFTTLTTVTVVNTSGVLDSGLSAVNYGILTGTNNAVPWQNLPTGFRVDNNGTNITGIPTSTITRIALSTERFDTNSEFASGTFTAKKAGIHRFYFQFGTANPTAGTILRAFLYVNGSAVARGGIVLQATSSETASVYTEVNLAVGDTVDTYVFHTRGTNEDIDGTAIITYFTGGYTGAA